MLPQHAPAMFGKGTAGEVWKSMLAEKMGAELARSGQVGIAKRLASAHAAMTGRTPPPAQSLGAAVPISATAALTSLSGNALRTPKALSGVLPFLQQSITEAEAGATAARVPRPDIADRS
jgi:hypothetical protein